MAKSVSLHVVLRLCSGLHYMFIAKVFLNVCFYEYYRRWLQLNCTTVFIWGLHPITSPSTLKVKDATLRLFNSKLFHLVLLLPFLCNIRQLGTVIYKLIYLRSWLCIGTLCLVVKRCINILPHSTCFHFDDRYFAANFVSVLFLSCVSVVRTWSWHACTCWTGCSFEKSNTHRHEVPKMLFEDSANLEDYVIKSRDKSVTLDHIFSHLYYLTLLTFITHRTIVLCFRFQASFHVTLAVRVWSIM